LLVNWCNFALATKYFLKEFNKDRVDFSTAEARSCLYYRYYMSGKAQKDIKYSSVKKFDCTQVIKVFGGVKYKIDWRYIALNRSTFENPFTPPNSLVDACYADISEGANGVFICRAPFKTGIRPSSANKNKIYQAEASVSKLMPERYRSSTIENVLLKGGWINALQQFQRFTSGRLTVLDSYLYNAQLVDNYFKRIKASPCFEPPTKMHMYFIPIKASALCGGETGNYFRNKSQGAASVLAAASKLWDVIHSKEHVNVSVYTLGGKQKAVKNKAIGVRVQARLLYQQDYVEFCVAKPYIKKIESFLFADDSNPIVIGKDTTGCRAMRLLKNFSHWGYNIEFDWSGWDSTVIADKIAAAFSVFRRMFPPSVEIDNAFVYFCDGLINKYTICPDGNFFKVTRGMPSGSGWTTIVNSMVNALIMEELLISYGPFVGLSSSYQVSGDDGNLFFDKKFKFSKTKLVRFCKRRFNMDIEITSVGPPISADPDKSATFNKMCLYWTNDRAEATVQPKALFNRFSILQKEGNEPRTFIDSVLGNIPQCIRHPLCHEVISAYWYFFNMFEYPQLDPFVCSQEIVYSVQAATQRLFDSPKEERLLDNVDYDAQKVLPIDIIIADGKPPDDVFVENWLKDNTLYYKNSKISNRSRHKYFERMMGIRVHIHLVMAKYGEFTRSCLKWNMQKVFLDQIRMSKDRWWFCEFQRFPINTS